MKKNDYQKKLENLTKDIYNRDDLHEAYKNKVKHMLASYTEDFFNTPTELLSHETDEELLSNDKVKKFIDEWVESRFVKGD